MLFDSGNLPYWIFLGLGVSCFLSVILTGGDNEDSTAAEEDLELEIDGSGDFSPGELLGILGIGKAPLILILGIDFSTWGVTGWILNLVVGSLTGEIPQRFWGLGGLIAIVSMFIAMATGKVLSYPLGKIFAEFGEDTNSDRLIGCVGTVTSKTIPYLRDQKIGHADVLDSYNNRITVMVTLPGWAKVIPHRGQQVLIIEQKSQAYLGIAKDSSDEDYWLNNHSN